MSLKSMFTGRGASINSIYRESITTFEFITGVMKTLANKNKKADIIKSISGDLFGYDIIIECEKIRKYIQLKVKDEKSKVASWEISNELLNNPEGELIVIYTNFISDSDWKLEYRIWDKTKIPKVPVGVGSTTISEALLEPERDIKQLTTYMFL